MEINFNNRMNMFWTQPLLLKTELFLTDIINQPFQADFSIFILTILHI